MRRFNTREAWLEEAARELTALFQPGTVLPPFKVSVGWPKGRRTGECWPCSGSADQLTFHIFIGPNQVDITGVILPTLLHELVHTLTTMKHVGAFVRTSKFLGFVAPWTTATCSEGLSARLREIAVRLGEYPHVGLSKEERGRKQPTRLLLWRCPCGDSFRRTRVNKNGKVARVKCLDCGGMFAVTSSNKEV